MDTNTTITASDIDLDFIINYCKENNQITWLKSIAKKEVEFTIYPNKLDEEGNPIRKSGKSKGFIKDRRAKPIRKETAPITFVQIKAAFIDEFMPQLKSKKEKKPSMYEIIENL